MSTEENLSGNNASGGGNAEGIMVPLVETAGETQERKQKGNHKAMEITKEQRQLLNMGADQEMDIDDYEIVGAEFFAQTKEPAFTVNVNKVTVNAAGVRLLPDADYVKILIKREERKLVLKPCSEDDIYGYKWAREKDGKRYASQRTGEPFVLILCGIMDWNPDNRYKILGKRMYSKGEAILVFDLTVSQCFEKAPAGDDGKPARRSAIPAGWNGRFGPTYGENRRTLHVDTFDGYTVFSIKGKSGEADAAGASRENHEPVTTGDTAIKKTNTSEIVPESNVPIPAGHVET